MALDLPEQNNGAGVAISGQATVIANTIVGGNQYVGYPAEQVSFLLEKIRTEFQGNAFDGRSPYVGLGAFQESDAERFFGRETLIADLVTRVTTVTSGQARALFLAGPSGSGKSSLVRAGLVPALKKGTAAGSENWLYETLKPGRTPLDELARVASALALAPDAAADLRTRAQDDVTRLHRWAEIALKDDAGRRAVIVVDQFEEIFTLLSMRDEAERAAFLSLLTYAATVPTGRTLVVFTMRSDFVTHCASYPALNALLSQQFIQVGAMRPDELVSAIARPAYRVGLRLDPALVAQIVSDVRGEPGALPLMQFALQDLFEAEKSKGELTLDGYTARGGLRRALERHAESELGKLSEAEKELARTVFRGLVEVGTGREDTRRTALLSELVPDGVEIAQVRALVHQLANARLLTTDERDGQETVTLAHERMIDAWGWLRRLVDENREVIALQNEIARDADRWEGAGRAPDDLYRGARLSLARARIRAQQVTLPQRGREFITQSILDDRRIRMQRLVLPSIVVIVILAGIGFLGYLELLRQIALGAGVTILVSNSTVRFEKFEVTNERYLMCTKAFACQPLHPPSTFNHEGAEQLPVTGVNFFQAESFCKWQLRRLPTFEEWKRAATNGGTSTWPWGSSPEYPNVEYANLNYESSSPHIEPVGYRAERASLFGIYDLIGNVWEWTTTGVDEKGKPIASKGDNASSTNQRFVSAGGGYGSTVSGLVSAKLGVPSNATLPDGQLGFRCVE